MSTRGVMSMRFLNGLLTLFGDLALVIAAAILLSRLMQMLGA